MNVENSVVEEFSYLGDVQNSRSFEVGKFRAFTDTDNHKSLSDFDSGVEDNSHMTMNERKTIDLEQGWEFMQKGITKLKNILEGLPESPITSEEYMMAYTYPYS